MNAAQGPFFLQHWVKGHPSESIIIWCLPVDAQSAQAQHRDPHRGLLHEGHQLAQRHPEGPILCEQLERERQVYGRFKTYPMGIFPFAALSLSSGIQLSPRVSLNSHLLRALSLSCSVFSPFYVFFFFNFICHGSFGTMNQGVMMGHDKQHYPAHPWQSVSLLGLDLCLSQWNVSLDQLGSYVVPYRSETTSFWSGMQPCPVVLACLPLYPNTLAPSPLSTLTHAHTEANR